MAYLVPIGDRDVNELRLTLAIFGAEKMTHDNTFITIHSATDDTSISSAIDMLACQVIVDASRLV